MPLTVTVYVPCYNAERTLGFCLASLLAQSHKPDRILLIDDGSTDRSVEIAQYYPGVEIVSHGGNRGLAAARNTAIHRSDTDLLASIDADCAAEPTWLAIMVKTFERNPAVHGCGGMLIEHFTDGAANAWRAAHLAQHHGEQPVANPPALYGANTVFRRAVLVALKGYGRQFRTHGEDWDLSRRLLKQVDRALLVYDPRARVRHLRRDTIASVIRTYWNYQTAVSWIRAPALPVRWRLLQIGRLVRQVGWTWLRRDLSEGRRSTLAVALVGVPYLLLLQARAWLRVRRALRAATAGKVHTSEDERAT